MLDICPTQSAAHVMSSSQDVSIHCTLYFVLFQVDNTQLMDVLKEEPSFSHDHFSEVKAATTAQAQPPSLADASGAHLWVSGHLYKSPYLRV